MIYPCAQHILTAVGLWLWAASTWSAAAEGIAYKEVSPGVEYAHISKEQGPLSLHVVKFDYQRPDLKLLSTLGCGTVFGLASVRKEIAALPPTAGQPIAGINGDFFVMKKDPYQGDPRGLQISAGQLVSSPGDSRNREACFWVDAAGRPQMSTVHSECKVRWPNGAETPIRINEQRPTNGVVLLTPILGPSTRTTNGVDLILEADSPGPWLPLRANQTYSARIREMHPEGNASLRPDILILSIGPKVAPQISGLEVGARLKIVTALSPDLQGVQTALGGGPVLVSQGQSKQRTSREARNPRSAIGWNDTDFYLVVVDGRNKDLSIGVGFAALADIMIELGCKEALNLDGGGSSTLWLNGEVANHPSEKGVERNVANALVLVRKATRSGEVLPTGLKFGNER